MIVIDYPTKCPAHGGLQLTFFGVSPQDMPDGAADQSFFFPLQEKVEFADQEKIEPGNSEWQAAKQHDIGPGLAELA